MNCITFTIYVNTLHFWALYSVQIFHTRQILNKGITLTTQKYVYCCDSLVCTESRAFLNRIPIAWNITLKYHSLFWKHAYF